jgi:hypothetical protein
MPAPVIYNPVHARARVLAQVGPVFQAGTFGFTTVIRNGLGDYTLTMGDEIDDTQRSTPAFTLSAPGFVRVVPVSDSQLQVLVFNTAGAAADINFEVPVNRVAQPS